MLYTCLCISYNIIGRLRVCTSTAANSEYAVKQIFYTSEYILIKLTSIIRKYLFCYDMIDDVRLEMSTNKYNRVYSLRWW